MVAYVMALGTVKLAFVMDTSLAIIILSIYQ